MSFKKKILVLITSVLFFSACKKEEIPASLPEIGDEVLLVAGYLPHYGFQRFDFTSLKYLDRLYYFSVAPDTNGYFEMPEVHVKNINQLKTNLKGLTTELFLVVGGWYESETIFPMAADERKRKLYIENIVGFCIDNKLDGVDLDWEAYPNKVPENDYVALVNELSSELRKYDLKFTVAVAASHHNISQKFYNKVDQLNIMSYGVLDPEGNQVPMEMLQGWLQTFDKVGVPRSKMIVGVPFYGKRPIKSGDTSPRAILYSSIVKSSKPDYNENRFGNYSFNGRGLMQTKTNYLKEYGYAGIMAWELSQDVEYDSEYSLLKTIVNTAKNHN